MMPTEISGMGGAPPTTYTNKIQATPQTWLITKIPSKSADM